MTSVTPTTRTAVGVGAVAASWGAGEAVERVAGVLPGPVAGLVVLAVALVAWPAALAVVGPVADATVRLLPVLFVPAVVAVAAVDGDVDVVAAAAAVAVSVPVGFLVAARVAAR